MAEFGFALTLPKYYQPDPELVETLRACIKEKERDKKGIL